MEGRHSEESLRGIALYAEPWDRALILKNATTKCEIAQLLIYQVSSLPLFKCSYHGVILMGSLHVKGDNSGMNWQ